MTRTTKMFTVVLGLALPVLLIGACAQTRTSDSTGEYVDDAAITAKVKTAILEDSALKEMQISVTTTRDAVHLSGAVNSPYAVARAGEVARKVAGVTSVENNLVVK
jgi:osmotically-inducible protein OsmY